MKKMLLLSAIYLSFSIQIIAQENRTEGRIIKDFGQTFLVENLDIKTDIKAEHKVIFDVNKSSEDKSLINKYIVTAARFLNMHAKSGLKLEQLHVAITIHGGAWKDVMTNLAYKEKYGFDNPNLELINQLSEAGVDIILCGQTAESRGLNKKNTNPKVKFALSAMTAILQYQNDGYRFLTF